MRCIMQLSAESPNIKLKLDKIIDYLKNIGCSKILLFGSYAEGKINSNSDIDIAVSGIKALEFYKAIAKLPLLINTAVDLVDFDDLPPYFQKSIQKNGIILYGN